uniref:Uncharacterized protein n=1 Tax=Manihot esculenta TaxID=3983 RepID=A0A2C9WHM9_MANES
MMQYTTSPFQQSDKYPNTSKLETYKILDCKKMYERTRK